jgi:HEAT repeat protein
VGAELPPVRAQAAKTLGSFHDPRAATALVKLLDDPSEQVRLSAAAAVLRGQGK